MKEPTFSIILKYALYAAFVVGVLMSATLPLMIDTYAMHLGFGRITEGYRAFIVPFLMIVSVPSLWAVLEMIGMMRSIPTDPFVMRNVKALNRIGLIFFMIAAAFLVKCFIFISFLTLVCVFFFIGSGLFSFTLAALIRQSIVFREENDLTI